MPPSFPQRGEIFIANLAPHISRGQTEYRPVLILQNDVGNRNAPVTIVAMITSAPARVPYPIDVMINGNETGLPSGSRVMLNKIETIDKQRLGRYIGSLSSADMARVDDAIKLSLDLDDR